MNYKSNFQESHFLRLQDYIAEGSKGELSDEEREYEDLLYNTANLIRKEGRIEARNWLQKDRGCSRYVAERITTEAINLFYGNDAIKDMAWRNVLFQKLMDAARQWEKQFATFDEKEKKAIPTSKDFDAYSKLLSSAARIKRLDQPDTQPQKPVIDKQLVVISTNASAFGMPATDRRAIMENPYFNELPSRHRRRLAMEAGLAPLDIDSVLDESMALAEEVEK